MLLDTTDVIVEPERGESPEGWTLLRAPHRGRFVVSQVVWRSVPFRPDTIKRCVI